MGWGATDATWDGAIYTLHKWMSAPAPRREFGNGPSPRMREPSPNDGKLRRFVGKNWSDHTHAAVLSYPPLQGGKPQVRNLILPTAQMTTSLPFQYMQCCDRDAAEPGQRASRNPLLEFVISSPEVVSRDGR